MHLSYSIKILFYNGQLNKPVETNNLCLTLPKSQSSSSVSTACELSSVNMNRNVTYLKMYSNAELSKCNIDKETSEEQRNYLIYANDSHVIWRITNTKCKC